MRTGSNENYAMDFAALEPGDVYSHGAKGELFMCIEDTIVDSTNDVGVLANAVSLTNGKLITEYEENKIFYYPNAQVIL